MTEAVTLYPHLRWTKALIQHECDCSHDVHTLIQLTSPCMSSVSRREMARPRPVPPYRLDMASDPCLKHSKSFAACSE